MKEEASSELPGKMQGIEYAPVASTSKHVAEDDESNSGGDGPPQKLRRQRNACSACRAAKMKCVRTEAPPAPCSKCSRSGRECVVPTRKLGRKPGSVNKFTELNRALRNAVQASEQFGRHGKGTDGQPSDLPALLLQNLLGLTNIATKATSAPPTAPAAAAPSTAEQLINSLSAGPIQPVVSQPSQLVSLSQAPVGLTTTPHGPSLSLPPILGGIPSDHANVLSMYTNIFQNDPLVVSPVAPAAPPVTSPESSDAKAFGNPLSLLSEVCTTNNNSPTSTPSASYGFQDVTLENLGMAHEVNVHDAGFKFLFTDSSVDSAVTLEHAAYYKARNATKLEVDDKSLDPIEMGVVTEEEVNDLFAFFHQNMLPMIMALDPVLCTPEFVRRTSPFLLTAVCACSAQFCPTSNRAMLTRISKFFEHVADVVKTRGYRSAGILHAFTLGSGWSKPAEHITEEKTWSHYTTAASIAIELGLHSVFGQEHYAHTSYTPSEAEIDACPSHLSREEATSRFRRHAERAWLHLFLWGTGLASTLGRPWVTKWEEIMPSKAVQWHQAPFALPEDAHVISILQLRRIVHVDIAPMLPQVLQSTGPDNWQGVKHRIESEFKMWHRTWLHSDETTEYSRTPLYRPYPALLYRHHRVLCYSLVLRVYQGPNLHSALVDCLRAALDVAHHVIKEVEEGGILNRMVNNVASMCLYSAVCAMKSLALLKPSNPEVTTTVLGLLGRMAQMLEVSGSTPAWRFGTVKMSGSHLKALLLTQGAALLPREAPQVQAIDPSIDFSNLNFFADDGADAWALPFTDTFGWFDSTYSGLMSHVGTPSYSGMPEYNAGI